MSRFSVYLCRCLTVSVISVAALPSLALAQQQDIQPLLDRLERLERDIRTLNVQIARGGEPAPLASASEPATPSAADIPAIARLGARMDNLEADLRVATGTLERSNYMINQVTERLDKLVSDIDFRLTALESGTGNPPTSSASGASAPNLMAAPAKGAVQSVAPTAGVQTLGTVPLSEVAKIESAKEAGTDAPASEPATTTATASAPPAGTLPVGTVKEQYTYAFNLLRQTNYEQAETALKAFISAHDDDPLASNARYWLGETYYARKAYQEAAQVFFEGYDKDPKGSKAPDSLLKLGMSLASLGKSDNACAAFAKVLADFPKASSTIQSAVARERKRNSCP